MGQQKSPKKLGKFLSYILGRRPDEFGLIPDKKGYVKIKDLLKVLHEEEGWRYVRMASLNEVAVILNKPPVEINDNLIRAKERESLPIIEPANKLPKLLYTCVRQKAHAFILNKGIFPLGGCEYVILSSNKELAQRMGRRIDPLPLLLTIQVQWSQNMGVMFEQFGEDIYLAEYIPVNCFTAPPLPKEKAESKKTGKNKEEPEKTPQPKTPGSFFLDLTDPEEKKRDRHKKRKKDIIREKEKRKQRQRKNKMWYQ